jgi:hypothetical protein
MRVRREAGGEPTSIGLVRVTALTSRRRPRITVKVPNSKVTPLTVQVGSISGAVICRAATLTDALEAWLPTESNAESTSVTPDSAMLLIPAPIALNDRTASSPAPVTPATGLRSVLAVALSTPLLLSGVPGIARWMGSRGRDGAPHKSSLVKSAPHKMRWPSR